MLGNFAVEEAFKFSPWSLYRFSDYGQCVCVCGGAGGGGGGSGSMVRKTFFMRLISEIIPGQKFSLIGSLASIKG